MQTFTKNRMAGINKTVLLLLTFVGAVSFISCKNKSIRSDTVVYELFLSAPTAVQLEAMGAELDPRFFSQNLTRTDGAVESDWQYVVDRVARMGLKKLRVMVLPQWYEPVNDNDDPHDTDFTKFTFESQEMRSLYKVLDMAQQLNMDVCIVVWGCPTGVSLLDPAYAHVERCFMADPDGQSWITGPTDYDEWAENLSALVSHLVDVKNYTCVNEITPINEPDGGPLLTAEEYIKMARVLDARFKKEGLRDIVRFNLSDNTDTRTFYLEECAAGLSDVADIFNSHTYIFGYGTPNSTVLDWERNNVEISARAGKKHLVGEFGSDQCVGATRQLDIDRYERGVLMTRLVLNFLNAGAAGVSYWSLIDQYYGKDADYLQMQQLGLWKYVKAAYRPEEPYAEVRGNYEVRPQYYSYSLLTRFLRPGAAIYPIEMNDEFAAGTAFVNADGKWVYVFANGTTCDKSVAVNNPSGEGSFEIYRYEENSLPDGDAMIIPDGNICVREEKLTMEVRKNSVVLCRQIE